MSKILSIKMYAERINGNNNMFSVMFGIRRMLNRIKDSIFRLTGIYFSGEEEFGLLRNYTSKFRR